MAKYRKKPMIIEAFRWTGGPDQTEDPEWIVEAMKNGHAGVDKDGESFGIKTLEGRMTAFPGDYIIRGIKDEIYPCKPDIFEATYENVAQPRVADRLVKEAIRVIGYLGLWDDHEFDELRELIEKYEEE